MDRSAGSRFGERTNKAHFELVELSQPKRDLVGARVVPVKRQDPQNLI